MTAITAAFFGIIAGFLIGISVEYPRINNQELSGTIGKVKKYSNAKVTEADIELQNELASDSLLLKSMKNYIAFYYANALSLGEQIETAVTESRSNTNFNSKYTKEIDAVERYGLFLNETRTDLLLMLALCEDPKSANAAVLKNFTTQAQNIIARTNYHRTSVIDLINAIESYILENKTETNKGLEQAHDLLTYNQAVSASITNDKMMLKYLDGKRFFSTDHKSDDTDKIKSRIEADQLQLKSFWDSEKLGITFYDSEELGFLDVEQLGKIFYHDSDKLNAFRSDNGKLGLFVADTEKLGKVIALDIEKLGMWSNVNSSELGKGPALWDNEKLGFYLDSGKLAASFT
jgi:hypothetical protein